MCDIENQINYKLYKGLLARIVCKFLVVKWDMMIKILQKEI